VLSATTFFRSGSNKEDNPAYNAVIMLVASIQLARLMSAVILGLFWIMINNPAVTSVDE